MLSSGEKKEIVSYVIEMGEGEINNFKSCLKDYTEQKNQKAYEFLYYVEKQILDMIDDGRL